MPFVFIISWAAGRFPLLLVVLSRFSIGAQRGPSAPPHALLTVYAFGPLCKVEMALMIVFPLRLKFLAQSGIFRQFCLALFVRVLPGKDYAYYGRNFPIELVVTSFPVLGLWKLGKICREKKKELPSTSDILLLYLKEAEPRDDTPRINSTSRIR